MSDWFLLALLSLTTYRLTRLVVTDDFPPVLWIRDRMVGDWREMTEAEETRTTGDGWTTGYVGDVPMIRRQRWAWVPGWLADLLSCSWCASGWISLGVVVSADLFTPVPLPVFMWTAVWALSALIAAQDWS